MNDKRVTSLREQELRRFHGAVARSVERLLMEKYEATRQPDEYRQYAKICGFVQNSLRIVDILCASMSTLFETTDERSNWEIYLSGLRRLFRSMPDSYLFRFVLPMFGLEGLREKVVAYSQKWLEQVHASQKYLRETDRYLSNLERGAGIAADYGADNLDVVRLYASLKTWQSKAEFDSFMDDLEDFLTSSIEVFVSGPIQLYLMLNRDTMLLIFKTLSVGRLGELGEGHSEYQELMKLSDFVREMVENSETLEVGRKIISSAAKEYAIDLRREQERLRAQLPSYSMKRGFVQRFEAGALFKREED